MGWVDFLKDRSIVHMAAFQNIHLQMMGSFRTRYIGKNGIVTEELYIFLLV